MRFYLLIFLSLAANQSFAQKLIPIKIDGKWGYKDSIEQNWVIKPQYERALTFAQNGLAVVCPKLETKCGCINTNGKMVIKPDYAINWFMVKKEYLQFNSAGVLFAAKAINKINAVYGAIDEKGKTLIPFTAKSDYQNFHPLANYHAIGFAKNYKDFINEDYKWGIVDSTTKVTVPYLYDHLSKLSATLFQFWQNGKQGVINYKGDTIIPIAFKSITIHKQTIIAKSDNDYSFYTNTGKVLSENSKAIYPLNSDRILSIKDHSFSIYSTSGNHINTLDSFQILDKLLIHNILKNKILVISKNDKIGFTDLEGKIIYQPIFSAVQNAEFGFIVTQNNKKGIIDYSLKMIQNYIYEDILIDGRCKLKNKWGLFSDDAKTLKIEAKFDELLSISHFSNYEFEHIYLFASKNDRHYVLSKIDYSLISLNNQIKSIIFSYLNDKIIYFVASNGGNYIILNAKGEIIINSNLTSYTSDFDKFERFINDHFIFFDEKNKKYWIDWRNKKVVNL